MGAVSLLFAASRKNALLDLPRVWKWTKVSKRRTAGGFQGRRKPDWVCCH